RLGEGNHVDVRSRRTVRGLPGHDRNGNLLLGRVVQRTSYLALKAANKKATGCGDGVRWLYCELTAVAAREVLASPVYVLEANDVILAQVTAGLDLDQFQRQLARVA